MTSPLVLSLFPGIGMLDMAFELEGFTVVRGPDVLWGGDVRSFHPPRGRFDGVIGGAPCQRFSSLAHLVRAKGYEPRFGNLIPEFERCVLEADPDWFLMENVPRAPVAHLGHHNQVRFRDGDQARLGERLGYMVSDFVLCNSWLPADDGLGQEQRRKRRWSFGLRGTEAPDLRRWIQPAALVLPDAGAAVASYDVNNDSARKNRVSAVTATEGDASSLGPKELRTPKGRARARTSAVVADARQTPVALGGSGKPKHRQNSVTAAPDKRGERPAKGGHGGWRTLQEMCRLQGLPEDYLEDAPFTMDGKRKAIANGVPIPMGRALARAVRAALEER